MQASSLPPSGGRSQVKVETFRVAEGARHRVQMLSDAIGGILTHWHGGCSQVCAGDGACPPALHRLKSVWKGYTPVQVWEPQRSRWVPWVLEITEALEHDLRGTIERGQVWELSRLPPTKRKRFPVVGVLLEQPGCKGLRPAFDIRPVLYRLFHVTDLTLDVANPMPAPLILEVENVPAAPPRPIARKPEDLPPADRALVLERLREARADIGRPDRNGKATGAHP